MIIEGMAQQGAEPTYCMGDDIPLAVLSDKPHMLYNYFKQRFAQVTNPPIDPLREGLVMSMTMRLGKRGNLLQPGPDAYSQVGFQSVYHRDESAQVDCQPQAVAVQLCDSEICLISHLAPCVSFCLGIITCGCITCGCKLNMKLLEVGDCRYIAA